MIPKDKAIFLCKKFGVLAAIWGTNGTLDLNNAKECALACVEEIELALKLYGEISDTLKNMDREFNYWEKVKEEINKI